MFQMLKTQTQVVLRYREEWLGGFHWEIREVSIYFALEKWQKLNDITECGKLLNIERNVGLISKFWHWCTF